MLASCEDALNSNLAMATTTRLITEKNRITFVNIIERRYQFYNWEFCNYNKLVME